MHQAHYQKVSQHRQQIRKYGTVWFIIWSGLLCFITILSGSVTSKYQGPFLYDKLPHQQNIRIVYYWVVFNIWFSFFQLQALTNVRTDIMKSLSLYYYTFVDLLDLKDHISELLTVMDALGMLESLDIVSLFCCSKCLQCTSILVSICLKFVFIMLQNSLFQATCTLRSSCVTVWWLVYLNWDSFIFFILYVSCKHIYSSCMKNKWWHWRKWKEFIE